MLRVALVQRLGALGVQVQRRDVRTTPHGVARKGYIHCIRSLG